MYIEPDLEEKVRLYNKYNDKNMTQMLGIEFTSLKKGEVKGKMPVHESTRQPFGLLHGGASAAFAETLASVGAWLQLDVNKYAAVGIEINANHIRSIREGWVFGSAQALHTGKTTQVWDIRISDEDNRLVCVSRCTLAVIPLKQS